MKKLAFLMILSFLLCGTIYAHTIDRGPVELKHWQIPGQNAAVDGSFYMLKGGRVYIELANADVVAYPLSALAPSDQEYVRGRADVIRKLNEQLHASPAASAADTEKARHMGFLLTVAILCVVCAIAVYRIASAGNILQKLHMRYLMPAGGLMIVVILFGFTSGTLRITSASNPLTLDSAFTPYKPRVATHWDANYFYVESYGIPAHEMMTGITSWQQQVPIPQCYTGTNAWSIPLNPVLADTPVPTATNFFRGAIALAANGVPIFNALTNTGADAYLAGQLDDYGGHSGRADDYHYHIAPLHLVPTSGNMPIAFALDGYAVYGANEPDGTPMTTLDTNHGHFGTNGVYHYHGTMVYPYMIGNMVGRVTEDTTSQIVPQPSASPVRPAQVPLAGAVITHCLQQGTNGYKLCYTLSGEVDTVSYNWTTAGLYTFNFISPSAGTTTQTYTGFIPCYVLPTRVEDAGTGKRAVRIFPNPAGSTFEIALSGDISANSVNDITLYNMAGQQVWHSGTYTRFVDVHNLPDGVYLLKVISANELFTNKIMIQ